MSQQVTVSTAFSTACELGQAQAYELTEYDRVVFILNFMGFSIIIFDLSKIKL